MPTLAPRTSHSQSTRYLPMGGRARPRRSAYQWRVLAPWALEGVFPSPKPLLAALEPRAWSAARLEEPPGRLEALEPARPGAKYEKRWEEHALELINRLRVAVVTPLRQVGALQVQRCELRPQLGEPPPAARRPTRHPKHGSSVEATEGAGSPVVPGADLGFRDPALPAQAARAAAAAVAEARAAVAAAAAAAGALGGLEGGQAGPLEA